MYRQKLLTNLFCIILVFLSQNIYTQVQTFKCAYKVNSVSFSPDSKYILSSSTAYTNGPIDLWDITGGLVKSFRSYNDYNNSVCFSPDGKYFANCAGHTLQLFSLESGIYKSLRHPFITCFSFSSDGKYIISGSKDKTIKQWNVETGENVRTLIGHSGTVTSLCISTDGKYLVSGSKDTSVKLWELSTGNNIYTFIGHMMNITSVKFSPDGKYIVSGSKDKSVIIWEVATGMKIRSYVGHTGDINSIDISSDGKYIISASDDKTLKLWNSNLGIITSSDNLKKETDERSVTETKPAIIWQTPYSSDETSKIPNYTIRAYIQTNSPLQNVKIFHNATKIDYDITDYFTEAKSKYDLNFEKNIVLTEGNNQVIIEATNSTGSVTSEVRLINYAKLTDYTKPGIIWQTPHSSMESSNVANYTVKACIKSNLTIIQVALYLNNSLWAFEKSFEPILDPECAVDFERNIELNPGSNEIKIEATNSENEKISESRIINYQIEETGRRLALVIGNANYSLGGTLANPINDAIAMSEVLKKVGFEVNTYTNADQKTIKKAMDEFGEKLDDYNVGLFYYAGHGVQVNGTNYIIPIDANLKKEQDVDYDCVEIGRILGKMEDSGNETNIIILDACRDNPFERTWSGRSARTRGLAFMAAPSGSIIAYATAPGNTASDGPGKNGLYTETLLECIQMPGLQIEEVFKNVRILVEKKSNNTQTPWESTSLKGEFYFIK